MYTFLEVYGKPPMYVLAAFFDDEKFSVIVGHKYNHEDIVGIGEALRAIRDGYVRKEDANG